jgi:sugar transferase (PEP-CTERM/EpsH1 system associated)
MVSDMMNRPLTLPDNRLTTTPSLRRHAVGQKRRVLFLTHRFPYPPNRGDRIRSYNLMRVLSESFDVTLGCPHDEPVTTAEHEHVAEICENIVTFPVGPSRWVRAGLSMLHHRSLTEGLFRSAKLQRSLLDLQREKPFDAVLVFCSSMFPYVDHDCFSECPVIVDLVDVDSEKWRQMAAENSAMKSWIYGYETERVRGLEQRLANRASAVILVSDNEADLFRTKVETSTPIVGVSNGVDTEFFHPSGSRPPQSDAVDATSRLVFTGVLDYPPNVEGLRWFCNDILPVLRERTAVQLDIVGRRPNQSVNQLGELDNVNLVGEVPDVRPYLHNADISISPLKLARGIQNKVLEAMACGLPVVTTTESAEGINAREGTEFLIADTEEDWVNALCKLGADPVLRSTIGRAARDLVVRDYGWSPRMCKITELVHRHLG